MTGPIDWDGLVLGPTMDAFGELVTYRPAAGAPFDIPDAVFDAAYVVVASIDGDDPPTNSTMPVLGVRLAAFPVGTGPAQSDTLYIHSVNKTMVVRDVRPDGHGHALLMLNLVRLGP